MGGKGKTTLRSKWEHAGKSLDDERRQEPSPACSGRHGVFLGFWCRNHQEGELSLVETAKHRPDHNETYPDMSHEFIHISDMCFFILA